MILVNTDTIPGQEITEVVGMVRGNAVGSAAVADSLVSNVKKALSSALALGPRIVTGDEVGLPKNGDTEPAAEDPPRPFVFEGELERYSDLLFELRQRALDRLTANAEKMGADAVIHIHFDITVILMHAFEVCAYGTAVKL